MSTKSTHSQHEQQPQRTKAFATRTARKIIQKLDQDHRFCSNCFRRIREVEEPPGTHYWSSEQGITRRAVVGFSYPTENTIPGVGIKGGGDDHPVADRYKTTRACECGSVHHRTKQRPLKKGDAVRAARNLSESIDDLRDEYRTAGPKLYERVEKWRHSERRLVTAIKHLKSNPDHQGAEKPIFEAALATALLRPDRDS